jgi:hypothetical protein
MLREERHMRKEFLLASVVVLALVVVSIQFLSPKGIEAPSESYAQTGIYAQKVSSTAANEEPSPPFIRKPRYSYRAIRRSDPFLSPIGVENESNSKIGLLHVEGARLVGIANGPEGRLALFEDSDGTGFVLKRGDRVRDGKVTHITDSTVKITRNVYGEIQRLTFRLRPKGEVHG